MIMIGAGQKNLSTYLKDLFKIFETIPSPNRLTWGNEILLVRICVLYMSILNLSYLALQEAEI